MKKEIILFVGLLLVVNPESIKSQENLEPFVVSPFIGNTLDRAEEEYFRIFPSFTDFREAVFYIDPDSLLYAEVTTGLKNIIIDTLIFFGNSPSYLENEINRLILKDIRQSKVKELKLNTYQDTTYTGTVYSYNNRQIKFIKEDFNKLNDGNNKDGYLLTLKYFDVNTITVNESDPSVTFFTGLLGAVAGGIIAASHAPKVKEGGIKIPNFVKLEYIFIGGIIGAMPGYLIGSLIEIPVDHDTGYPETEQILYENALLPGGLDNSHN